MSDDCSRHPHRRRDRSHLRLRSHHHLPQDCSSSPLSAGSLVLEKQICAKQNYTLISFPTEKTRTTAPDENQRQEVSAMPMMIGLGDLILYSTLLYSVVEYRSFVIEMRERIKKERREREKKRASEKKKG